jgi:hypothetical protein
LHQNAASRLDAIVPENPVDFTMVAAVPLFGEANGVDRGRGG